MLFRGTVSGNSVHKSKIIKNIDNRKLYVII